MRVRQGVDSLLDLEGKAASFIEEPALKVAVNGMTENSSQPTMIFPGRSHPLVGQIFAFDIRSHTKRIRKRAFRLFCNISKKLLDCLTP